MRWSVIYIENNTTEKLEMPFWLKLNLTINEASEYSNIGRDRIRELASERGCPFSLKIGKKVLIKRKAFEEYIENVYVI